MKIISWNCNMAFRRKMQSVLLFQPDVLIVPECEHPEKIIFSPEAAPTDWCWVGKNRNKGLGIFSFSATRLSLHPAYNEAFKWIVPLQVYSNRLSFLLFAVWANNPADAQGAYITQVWKALHFYEKLLHDKPVMWMGDFNSNSIWDRKHRKGNHSDVVAFLNERNIVSTYHQYYQLKSGLELHPTLYMYRHEHRPYHIDYCFVSTTLISQLLSVKIGPYTDWAALSDHAPLEVEFMF